jgi:predicted Zn-dependent protease
MKIIYSILFCLLLVSSAVADGLPDLGDVSQAVLSPQVERRIGEETMRDILASGEIVDDIEVMDYLQALGYRLATNGPDNQQRFSFFGIKDSSINAFALPGGFIGMHTGLIITAQSESELASVLAHEIGHVVQHHMARMIAQQSRDMIPSLAALALAILASRASPELGSAGMAAVQAGGIQRQLDYTREHEREADRVGLQILNQAGFDTSAMPTFFEHMMKGTRFADSSAPSFLRTHPLTTERIAEVRNRVEKLPYRQVRDSPEFQYVRAKLRADQDDVQLAIAQFEDSLRQKRYASEAAQHYGLATALERAREYERARTELDWLYRNAQRHPMIETLAAKLEADTEHPLQALEKFREALTIFPNHRGLIYGCADLLLALGRVEEALKLVANKSQLFPDDAYLYELQAQAYTRQGKELLRHRAQGEAYYRQYDLASAVEQMELAQKSKDGDFYQQSIVEARLNQWRKQMGDPKDPKKK